MPAAANACTLKIRYVTMQKNNRGDFKEISYAFANLDPESFYGDTEEIKENAKHDDITITIDLGRDFMQSGKIADFFKAEELAKSLKGTHIDALRVVGQFDEDYDVREKMDFWCDLKALVNFFGLDFREDAEIVYAPIDLGECLREGLTFVKRNTE